jgi:hypothetical protein
MVPVVEVMVVEGAKEDMHQLRCLTEVYLVLEPGVVVEAVPVVTEVGVAVDVCM